MRLCFFIVLACCLWWGCTQHDSNSDKIKIQVTIQAAYHKKIYLQQQVFNGGQPVILDSGVVQSGLDTFVFYVPKGEQQLYAITVAESALRIPFITDSTSIEVYYNYATRRYGFKNSIASNELKQFTDRQIQTAKYTRVLKRFIDSVESKGVPPVFLKDSLAKFNDTLVAYLQAYKNFADTVPSPAAFFAVYDAIVFGDDRAGLKAFITKAKQRFANHTGIQTLAKSVLEYIKVLDEPFNIGDTLPVVTLPDEFGIDFSTASLNGKYVVVNIWSSLCTECEHYAAAIANAKQVLPAGKFEAVSIALDDKASWLAYVKRKNYNWPQLIDEKMWDGPAFKTLRFDNIPYNFILAPGGKILAKAVRADSIAAVLQKFVH